MTSDHTELQFYKPNLLTKIMTDSSKYGFGAVMEQNNNRKWLPHLQRLLQKKTLSILFACKTLHQFIYGTHFVIENNHKPLKRKISSSI